MSAPASSILMTYCSLVKIRSLEQISEWHIPRGVGLLTLR